MSVLWNVNGGWWAVRRGLRKCAVCHRETSVTAGTIFHGSRLPLTTWFAAIWYVVNQKNGVSALGLQHVLEFGSYQTAWAWLHKLRRAMVLPGRELLSGVVEVDESYVGARRTGAGGRRAAGKAIVAIAVEGDQAPERARMRRIRTSPRTRSLTSCSTTSPRQRSPDRRLAGLLRHRTLPLPTRCHQRIGQWRPAHVALPHVHLVSLLLQRWILGTHQAAISHAQLDYDLDEFTFRFNRRRACHRGLLFYRLLEGALPPARTPTQRSSRDVKQPRPPPCNPAQSVERGG